MIKNILFDFDGVILDSMPIRDYGFKKIFEDFDDDLVNKLLEYHNQNGGLSRYVKIKYFYNKLLKQEILEEKIINYANNFSMIMKKELVDKKYLIADTLRFIMENYKKYNLHIVSGSDEKELQYLCKELGIDSFFQSVNGSPIHKNILVESVLAINKYMKSETILIGDSINDYEAAKENNLVFYGFNNIALQDVSKNYISKFNDVEGI
jgi:HAD superfamily hydrolase (TIGR01549 family)